MPVMALPYDQGTLDRVRNGVSPAIVNNNNNANNNQNVNNNQLINNIGNGGNNIQAINGSGAPVAPVAPVQEGNAFVLDTGDQLTDPEYAYIPAPSVGQANNAIENVNNNINNSQNVNNNQLINNNNNNVINGGAPAQPIIRPEPVQPEPVVSILPVPPIPAASEIAQDGGIVTPSLPSAAVTTVLGQDPPGVTGYDAVDITFNEFEIVQDGVPKATVDVLDFVPLDGSQGLEEIIVTPALPDNVPVPVGTGVADIINATAPNNIVPIFENSTLPTATMPAMPLFTNGTNGFATPTLGGLATGTGLSTAVATISGIIGITNLTNNATVQAYPYPGARPYNPSVDAQLYTRAPMPPLRPHVLSYLANQDKEQEMSRLNSIGVSVHEWVRRTVETAQQGIQGTNGKGEVRDGNGQPTGQSFLQQHLGVFLCALAGVIMLMIGVWYMGRGMKSRTTAMEDIRQQEEEGYKEKVPAQRKAWYTRFGFKRHDQPVPYAGHIGSFNDANRAEEGGLRAAMGGNWNGPERNSWETQRTAPPAYRGEEGLTDEKDPRGGELSNTRLV